MNILIVNDGPGAHQWERLGICRALAYCGYKVAFWDINGSKSAHDIFSEIGQIDLFIGQSYNLNRAVMKCLSNHPETKVIVKLGDWGDFYSGWDDEKHQTYPILMASDEDRKNVAKLSLRGQLGFGFIHYHPSYINQTHNRWTDKFGVKVVSLMNAYDIFEYSQGRYMDELSCDCSMVGGRCGYKAKVIDKWILPLCNPKLNLNIKIFGQTDWNIPQYYGPLTQGYARHLFKSTTVNLNCHEPHSQEFGFDINERVFKVMGAGGFLISDYVAGLTDLYSPDSLVTCGSPNDFREKLYYFIHNPESRHRYSSLGQKKTLESHTYFDRILTIFENLNLDTSTIKERKSNAIKELQ